MESNAFSAMREVIRSGRFPDIQGQSSLLRLMECGRPVFETKLPATPGFYRRPTKNKPKRLGYSVALRVGRMGDEVRTENMTPRQTRRLMWKIRNGVIK